jgi:hypothetical protein
MKAFLLADSGNCPSFITNNGLKSLVRGVMWLTLAQQNS